MDEKIKELEALITEYKVARVDLGRFGDFESSVEVEVRYNDIVQFAKNKM